ncbi:MAG: hypothetical protein JSU70_13230 [Phycisphaerales bacterium]|nr:MAG: hypothetical protein JSU70_13230 [Phycisphaerales bacterium]
MTIDNSEDRKEVIPAVLVGVSVLLAVMVLVKVTSFLATSAKAENMVRMAELRADPSPEDMKTHLAGSKAVADGLKKKNLFAPPPPRQNPVQAVIGILGNRALINDKWYEVGDTVGDAKVVAIEATRVKIEWDGREKTFTPITSSGESGPGGPRRPGSRPARRGQRPEAPEAVVVEPREGPMPGPGGFGMMRERFMNMSEAERAEFRERMRERFGDRGPGGFRGPGGERGEGRGRGPSGGRGRDGGRR